MLKELENANLAVSEEEVYGAVARGDYGRAGSTLDFVADSEGVEALELLNERFHNSTFRNSVETRNAFQGALRRAYLARPDKYEQRGLHYFVRK